MTVASLAGSFAGLLVGARYGTGEAVVGLVVGFMAAAALVFVLNAVLMLLSRLLGRNPAEIENGIAAMAAWGTAGVAILVAAVAALRLY